MFFQGVKEKSISSFSATASHFILHVTEHKMLLCDLKPSGGESVDVILGILLHLVVKTLGIKYH